MNSKTNNEAFHNPAHKAAMVPLTSSFGPGMKYLLIEVELGPGGRVPPHYHTVFAKKFIAVSGVLHLKVNGNKSQLYAGETAYVDKRVVHSFWNAGKDAIRFQVKMEPASQSFLESLIIGYGLAADGKTNRHGMPKDLDHAAVLLKYSNSRLPGIFWLFERFLMHRAKFAERRGVREMLVEKYCR